LSSRLPFRGKVAIVTGAGQGIGRRIALDFLGQGASVALVGRDPRKLKRTILEAGRAATRAIGVRADISQEKQVRRMVRQAVSRFGHLDILVNNAGARGPTAPVVDLEFSDWQQVVDVNLTGTYLCSREALKIMLPRRKGSIVNMSSVAGRHAYPLRAAYSASKWGVIGLTLSLAQESGVSDVRVNAICPGPVEGPGLDGVIVERARKLNVPVEEMRDRFLRPLALGRPVTEEDISRVVQFLCSPAAKNITGQVINVDSGFGLWPIS
jgi:NAD(P)-dependent dehydrogenase (short-subunit alcohol dehydrogenase family)